LSRKNLWSTEVNESLSLSLLKNLRTKIDQTGTAIANPAVVKSVRRELLQYGLSQEASIKSRKCTEKKEDILSKSSNFKNVAKLSCLG